MARETRTKAVIYSVAAILAAPLACRMAHCGNVLRIVWDPGNSHPGMLTRFYFLVLMGLVVVITQNVFIRRALRKPGAMTQGTPAAAPQEATDE